MKTLDVPRERAGANAAAGTLLRPWLSSKVQPRHLDRSAVVYVRQSSAKQVTENRESTEMQYRLRERAEALGWSASRVLIIDDDLGLSGQTINGRPGFQRLLAEVGLDHVGIVLGLEMSRLARSCRDWHQLLELCAVFGTLLGDADGVYDPCDYNDRLLLGLKGTMSEAELHVLRGRLEAGQRNKAHRGELFSHAPIGYVRSRQSGLEVEPDEQARAVVQLIFDKFQELGSVAAVLRYLKAHGLLVGVRPHRGSERDQLVWRRPNRATLLGMLHHPVYAGAYVYGRRMTNPRKQVPGRRGSGRAWAPPEQWDVLIRDQLPAYITWEQYETNQRRLRDNSASYGRGTPHGGSLLSGIVTCGRCGKHMSVSYADRSKARFTCDAARNQWGEPQCQALTACPLETLVAGQVLLALEPASLELSLAAAEQIEGERQRLQHHHRQQFERATYEVERAWRQYTQVEPEHRLVARELERRWEAALAAQRAAEETLDQFRCAYPARLTDSERQCIRELATNVPALWHAKTTQQSDRQQIVRQLLECVEVAIIDGTERVEVTLHWMGGYESRHEIRRTVSSYRRLAEGNRVLQRVSELKQQGLPHAEVARRLNLESFRAPRGTLFTVPMVTFLCRRARQAGLLPPVATLQQDQPSPTTMTSGPMDCWRGSKLAKKLSIPAATLNTWRRRGWLHARQWAGRWLYWANGQEFERLQALRHYPRAALTRVPANLTTPTGEPSWPAQEGETNHNNLGTTNALE